MRHPPSQTLAGTAMTADDRARWIGALGRARTAAYGPGEDVGQESFVRAREIRLLAGWAGIAPGVSVLDVCCGIGGPGRLIARETGCDYVGVDADAGAIAIARTQAAGLPCRFAVATVPPLPDGTFDVVLLLETMLAFADKRPLFEAIAAALPTGGRFAFTLEEGAPLTGPEREQMPGADTVWLTPLDELRSLLGQAGLTVCRQDDWSASHRDMASALADAYAADRDVIATQIGRSAVDDLIAAHRLWCEWLDAGRVRKLAVLADRTPT